MKQIPTTLPRQQFIAFYFKPTEPLCNEIVAQRNKAISSCSALRHSCYLPSSHRRPLHFRMVWKWWKRPVCLSGFLLHPLSGSAVGVLADLWHSGFSGLECSTLDLGTKIINCLHMQNTLKYVKHIPAVHREPLKLIQMSYMMFQYVLVSSLSMSFPLCLWT